MASSAAAGVLVTKWLGLVAGMWVQGSGGSAYMFPSYSPLLKSFFKYKQLEVNNLGVAKDLGENVGLLAGMLCNKLPAWLLLCIGALESVFGYGTVWLVVSGRIAPLPYWQVSCRPVLLLVVVAAFVVCAPRRACQVCRPLVVCE